MARSTEEEVQELVARFAADLLNVVQKAALASFAAAFEFKGELGAKAPTRPRGRPAAAPGRRAAKRAGKRPGKRTVGGKRNPTALAKLTERLGAHIAAHAGQDIREIGAAVGARTAELALPIKKLLADKTIKKRGERRNTKYFPA